MSITSRGGEMISIVSVLVGVALITVIMRVFARLKRRVGFGVDDYLCFLSMVLLIAMLIELALWVTIGGNGAHMRDLNKETLVTFSKIFLANQFTYFVLSPAIKISIICFYRRIFTMRPFQWVTFGLNTLITLWGAAIFLACALQCRPLRAYWDKSIEGHCFDSNEFFIVNQVFNVIMDFVILALPVPMIWNLQRAWQDKLALNGVFALGAFVCFASIYRIVVLFWIKPDDTTYTVYQATLWTHIEPSIGLICSCLPIVRGLFPRFKISGSRKYASAPYYINTDVSTSHFVVSSPKSPALEYYKMEDTLVSRSISDTTVPAPDINNKYLGPMDITVRTDINISQDVASMKSHS
ncbi:uncharacterized protein ATNIH1004_004346 [Aspergillus tanneri]|uniref:Rhodopsin domain-containing protein n=1 Tax=Aspergillus tanneri TaxID=1220188 RepID=A0A5M9MN49_9EURO|nr:uncharacterized protein ATNIH1004_004346 [Aspergillus tanneri]KAA8648461.1 hypothetical protein ATNIH1004_004346 [Aspergillus tanneri]